MVRLLRQRDSGLFILPRTRLAERSRRVRAFLDETRCPVLVVGGAEEEPDDGE